MNKKVSKKIFFSVLLLCLSTIFSQAQETTTSAEKVISPEKKALIKEYLEATGRRETIYKNLDASLADLDAFMPQITEAIIDGDGNLTEAQKAEVKKQVPEMTFNLVKKIRNAFTKELDFAKVVEDITYPLLDKYFTEAELKDLVAFYKSPTAQKAISLQPEIFTEVMRKMNAVLIPAMQKAMKTAAEEEIAVRTKKIKRIN